jgi:hypothetical protein
MNRNNAMAPGLLVGGIIILICKQMQCKISGNKLDGRSLVWSWMGFSLWV